MSLTPAQLAERKTRIGGSDAPKIVSGDPRAWVNLWMEKTGRLEPEDLTWILPVQIGIATEALNLAFFAHATGRSPVAQGEVRIHPDYPFIGCTLDGLVEPPTCVVQCKHVNAFSKIEEVEALYYPQCAHEMLVTGAEMAFLSVIIGTQTHEIIEIVRDEEYTRNLLELERMFWRYVTDDEPPDRMPSLVAPPRPLLYREVDMHGSNSWAINANQWTATELDAKTNATAAKNLRGMVETDVGRAWGHGVEIRRSKSGSLLLTRMK